MTALQTPAPDAPAAEWGALATRIPDWRWPESCPLPGSYRKSPDASWGRVHNIELFAWGEGECIPDPDHWAWSGWMLQLLGQPADATELAGDLRRAVVCFDFGRINRACIAYAAAFGRWPGGDR